MLIIEITFFFFLSFFFYYKEPFVQWIGSMGGKGYLWIQQFQ